MLRTGSSDDVLVPRPQRGLAAEDPHWRISTPDPQLLSSSAPQLFLTSEPANPPHHGSPVSNLEPKYRGPSASGLKASQHHGHSRSFQRSSSGNDAPQQGAYKADPPGPLETGYEGCSSSQRSGAETACPSPIEEGSDSRSVSPERRHLRRRFSALIDETPLSATTRTSIQSCESRLMKRVELRWPEEERRYGTGSTGTVCKAYMRATGEKVAVKKMESLRTLTTEEMEEAKIHLITEAKSLKELSRHPNIVDFKGLVLSPCGSSIEIVLEHMGGGDLESFFQKRIGFAPMRRVSKWLSVQWSCQLFSVLEFLQDQQPPVIHRDLKPANLLLSSDWMTLKVSDFDLCREMHTEPLPPFGPDSFMISKNRDSKSNTGPEMTTAAGSPRWMAPEVLERYLELDKAMNIGDEKRVAELTTTVYNPNIDVYSAGLLIWFFVEGQFPFSDLKADAMFGAKLQGKVPTMTSRFPKLLQSVVERALSLDPAVRPWAKDLTPDLTKLQMETRKSFLKR